jgi:solute carrier family 25 carnitine/acylcarnitine transporter 20/29
MSDPPSSRNKTTLTSDFGSVLLPTLGRQDDSVNSSSSSSSTIPAASLLNEDSDDDDPSKQTGSVSALYDLIAGGVAGSASVIVGHPFDTIKVRIQTSAASNTSIWSMATQFGGVTSLYRGMAAPLVSASAINAVIFSSYATSSRYWDNHFADSTELQLEQETGHDVWQKAFCCGSFAGLVQCVIICPTEHVKCRLQIQHGRGAADNIYKGPLQAATSIVRTFGISGLFRGWNATAWREIPAFGLYFSVYDYCKDKVTGLLADRANLSVNEEVPHSHLWISSTLAGGLSGSLTWGVIYPIDVIKSRIQTAPMETPLAQRRIWHVGKTLVAKYGWQYMFRGLGITLIRAFPVNGIIFPVYEFTLLHLSGELNSDD